MQQLHQADRYRSVSAGWLTVVGSCLQQVSAGANPAARHQVEHVQPSGAPVAAIVALLLLLLLLLLALAAMHHCRQHR
jgi:hypothetical protein